MTNENEVDTKTSPKDHVKNALANRKVQLGLTVAITATVTALIVRSELFETRYTLDEVGEIVNDVVEDVKTYG